MIADVDLDLDGTLEILGRESFPLCRECPVTRRVVRVYRWNGAGLVEVALEVLRAGSASDAAVAANNRAVELARARRWVEAVAVLDDASFLTPESVVFRRNATLIDLNAGIVGRHRLSEDALLHYVFAGAWAEAAGLFRDVPVGPDLFAEPLAYASESAGLQSGYGTPPFMRAIFDATAAARAVAPARSEIEFLHAWSAFHLADTTPALVTDRGDLEYLIDVDEAALLEVFDRAVALAPGDPLFAEARRRGDRPECALSGLNWLLNAARGCRTAAMTGSRGFLPRHVRAGLDYEHELADPQTDPDVVGSRNRHGWPRHGPLAPRATYTRAGRRWVDK